IEDRLAKEARELLRGRSSSVGDDDDGQRPENGRQNEAQSARNSIGDRSRSGIEVRREKLHMQRIRKLSDEVSECTFTPKIPGRRSEEWDESSVYGRLYGDAMKRLHARIEGSSTAPPDSSHDAGRRSFTEHMADSIMRL
ncbi:hypothetical protein FOZ63_025250, partial [Perkinsus olseni]